jgi:D-alanine-D-alanine ligase
MIQRDLTIAIVYSLGEASDKGEARDLLSMQETAELAQLVEEALHTNHRPTVKIPVSKSLDKLKKELERLPVSTTFVFNFCEDFGTTSMDSIKVARLIENMGFMYAGRVASSIETCVDKAHSKQRLVRRGVPTPAYQIFTEAKGPCRLEFPVIVKPVAEDASCGIDLESVVSDPASLYARVQYILERYQQPALVEQFISGPELTVSILGNSELEFLPVSEIDYTGVDNPLERIRTYDSKWVEDSPEYKSLPYRCPARLSPELTRQVCAAAGAAYQAVGMQDYGRVDLRLEGGRPYVLEVNEAPDLGPDASFPASALAAGYTYAQMVERILQIALQREAHQRLPLGAETRRTAWQPAASPHPSYSTSLVGD